MSKFIGMPRIDRLFASAKETVNDRGNRVRHLILPGDRYLFDFNLDLGIWEQLDTENDAGYFGVWINKTELRILSFVEGDLYLTLCPDPVSYDAEVSELCANCKASPAYVVLSEGKATHYFQDRSQFFIDPAKAPETEAL